MAPTLYQTVWSPPVRAVLMTARAIKLELNLKEIHLFKEENQTPEYLKMNPQHTVPMLKEDDGFVFWESHAIMPYLISVYAKDDSLYTKDPRKRAIIDQRLNFDSGILFARLLRIFRPILFFGKKTIDVEDKIALLDHYAVLEVFLEGHKWIAGDSVTIADYSIITTLCSLNLLIPVDEKRCPRLKKYLKNAEKLPEYAVNLQGLEDVKSLFKDRLGLEL